jgi:beta-galactosidase
MNINNPTLEWLSNPEVFRVNRMDAHSDHWFYERIEDVILEEKMPLKQSLNGKWRFSYSENPKLRMKDFYKNDFDCGGLDYIAVPGHIQTQGYGKNQYLNTMYPWEGQEEVVPPNIPEENNPVGSYITYFNLKEELKSKEVILSFQGVEAAFYVWVNGIFLGYSEDSFTPSEFNITDYIIEGENKLAVEVYKISSASWLEDQDFWRFSGIFREVYLYAIPSTHIQDLFFKTDFDDAYESASLSVEMKMSGNMASYVKAILVNGENETIELGSYLSKETVNFEKSFEKVKLWSAEDPYLYTLNLQVYSMQDELIEVVPYKLGFRKFELKDGLMCLNGKRILFKGINRHEFNCDRGRSITAEDMLWDIRFLKQNNINAIRTCHYPNQSMWYRLCDEYGIYLIDETNLESHGSWRKLGQCDLNTLVPGSLPNWREVVIDRAASMFERDKNHASILIWSCGNESYAGDNILAMSNYFHERDNTRLVHYEGVTWDRSYDKTTDMETRMYAKPAEIEEYLRNNPKKPYLSCEYMHAMGNSCGGMHLYTELEDKYPKYQGGFIWDYIDQALRRINEQGEEVLAYGGDFEDRPSDQCFCTNGIVYSDRTPSSKVQEVKFLYQNVKLIPDSQGVTIKNKNLFISTKDYEFVSYVERNGEKIFEISNSCVVEAQEERYIHLNYPTFEENGEYTFNVSMRTRENTIWAKKGHEVSFGQAIVTFNQVGCPKSKSKIKVIHGDVTIGIQGKNFSAMFSKKEGGLISLCYDKKEYITRMPMATFWRATTDNDKGTRQDYRCGNWQIAGMYPKLQDYHLEENPEDIKIIYRYLLPTIPATENIISYQVTADGTINVKLQFNGAENLPEIPAYGMEFKLKESFHLFQYYGLGPEENYIDRNSGARLGIFKDTAAHNMSKYLVPQECGNRTNVRWLEVSNNANEGLRFTYSSNPFECSVLPFSAYELENATHVEELPKVHYTWIRILAKQMGVGGDDSWGAPVHDAYMIPSNNKKIDFTFSIQRIIGR